VYWIDGGLTVDQENVRCERLLGGGKLVFHIIGRFDYASGVELKTLAKSQRKAKEYVIDLKEVSYINSSAFGVMLAIREIFEIENSDIFLINASPDIRKMLSIVNFDQLFTVV
jgi:HptB-dependent secretion and biofilm anti anti-sigma factor